MHTIALALIAMLHVSLAIAVWRAKPAGTVNRLFAIQTLTFASWTFGVAWLRSGIYVNQADAFTFASASLIPAAILSFTINYPAPVHGRATRWQVASVIGGVFFAAVALATDWISYDVRFVGDEPSRKHGPLYVVFAVYFLTVVAAGLFTFVQKWVSARERQRTQLSYYGVGILVSSLGGITANLFVPLATGASAYSHFGPYFGLPLIALTSHAIIRHRFMDLRLVIHRGLTLSISGVVSASAVIGVAALVTRQRQISISTGELLLGGIAILAVTLLTPLARDVVEQTTDRYVYRTRMNPRRLLREASSDFTGALDLATLLDVISKALRGAVQPEGVAVYLDRDGVLDLSLSRRFDANSSFTAPPEPDRRIVSKVQAARGPIVRDELELPEQRAEFEAFAETHWAVAIPLLIDDQLVGLFAVAAKRSGDPFFSEDIDALTTLANHASLAVRNATLYGQVRLANDFVNSIVGAMQNGVIAVDTIGGITLLNPSARSLLGVAPDANLKLDSLPHAIRSIVHEVLDGGDARAPREITTASTDGSTPRLALLCTGSALNDNNGRRAGAVIVFSDLTPLKELDHERSRAEMLANWQRLAQTLAHEIGNPLVPIKTMTMLLPHRVGDAEFAQNLARIVARELDRIERLVSRLRLVAPREDPRLMRVDLRVPIRHAIEVVDAAAADQGTALEVALPQNPIMVSGESVELEELVLNLLTNALDAVVSKPHGSRRISVAVAVEDTLAVTTIEDSGPGIAADVLHNMFDPFITTKEKGSGLGLSICTGIAERHHGRLTAANAVRGGAIFTLTVPLLAADPGAKRPT